jgi:hypothetical protein
LLKRQGALEKLPAVQPAAQNKMSFEQRSRVAENIQNLFLCHAAKI